MRLLFRLPRVSWTGKGPTQTDRSRKGDRAHTTVLWAKTGRGENAIYISGELLRPVYLFQTSCSTLGAETKEKEPLSFYLSILSQTNPSINIYQYSLLSPYFSET